jgi:hypothetical protein
VFFVGGGLDLRLSLSLSPPAFIFLFFCPTRVENAFRKAKGCEALSRQQKKKDGWCEGVRGWAAVAPGQVLFFPSSPRVHVFVVDRPDTISVRLAGV